MKTKISALFLFLLAYSGAFAQANEGTITYAVTLDAVNMPNLSPDQQEQVKDMMKNITLAISFKDKNFRADLDMGMASASTIKVGGKTTILSETMGAKYKINGEDMEKAMKASGKEQDYDIEYTNDTMTIAGYLCKKAIIKKKDGTTAEIYYTDKLPATYSEYAQYPKFKEGCPMKFTMNKSGMVMSMIATQVNLKPVSNDIFTIPDGYQELTMDQLKQMSGGSK